MGNLPNGRNDQLTWFENHIDAWKAAGSLIGVTTTEMTNFEVMIQGARDALKTAEEARDTAKSKTQGYYDTHRAMLEPGRAFIATIKAFAERTDDPNVYVLANIDQPGPATPAQPPALPTSLTGSVGPTGQVMMSWDAEKSGAASGIFFLIARQRAGETGFTTLGGTADKFYNDMSPGVCDGIVSYQIKAMRGQLGSNWTMPVMFTLSSSGGSGVVGSISTPQGVAKAA